MLSQILESAYKFIQDFAWDGVEDIREKLTKYWVFQTMNMVYLSLYLELCFFQQRVIAFHVKCFCIALQIYPWVCYVYDAIVNYI
jgi:hypothetical protein